MRGPGTATTSTGRSRTPGSSVALLGALSFMAPLPTLPVLWAGVVQFYVIEEWVHHSVHYLGLYKLGGPYWRYINRHHAYHHRPQGWNWRSASPTVSGISSSARAFRGQLANCCTVGESALTPHPPGREARRREGLRVQQVEEYTPVVLDGPRAQA